ncbi:MAG: hypothetical protein KGI54_09880 [Pseudomonadota bacterium]|nr:hypothetical protein [Pseudomonadota bacterium]
MRLYELYEQQGRLESHTVQDRLQADVGFRKINVITAQAVRG